MSQTPPIENRRRRAVLRQTAALTAGALTTTLRASDVLAQDAAAFPNRPIRLVLPFPPGSATDTVSRYLSKRISDSVGQPVVVENRPGGNGFIAVQNVLSSPADGYSVLIGSNSTLWTNAALFKQMPYDPLTDLTPLTTLFRGTVVLIVPSSSPYQKLDDLLAEARKRPEKITFGSASMGYRLMVELLAKQADVKLLSVPYKGASEVIAAIASNTIDFAMTDMSGSAELIRTGKVRALGVASEHPSALMPELRTVDQMGLSGYSAYTWVAAAVSSKTPPAIAGKLVNVFSEALAAQETRDMLARNGLESAPAGPAFLRKFQVEQMAREKRIVAETGIEMN